MKKFSLKTCVAIIIGAALFFALGHIITIPSPIENVAICLQYGLLAFVAALFGPVAGAAVGFIGHFFIDFSDSSVVWYSWIIGSALFGLITGLITRKVNLMDGVFSRKDRTRFIAGTVIANVVSWALAAPVLDILIYKEPASKVFIQGLVSCGSNIVTTLIIGLILCFAFAAAMPKKGSREG